MRDDAWLTGDPFVCHKAYYYSVVMDELYPLLDELAISYERTDHAAVFSAHDIEKSNYESSGADTKNLVVTDSKEYYLIVVPLLKRVNLKKCAEKIGARRFSFASADILKQLLGVEPGSVSMLGLFKDTEKKLHLIIDEAIWNEDSWAAHPLVNTATLVITKDNFLKFFQYTGHTPKVVDIPEA